MACDNNIINGNIDQSEIVLHPWSDAATILGLTECGQVIALVTPQDQDVIKVNGDGDKALFDDGEYKLTYTSEEVNILLDVIDQDINDLTDQILDINIDLNEKQNQLVAGNLINLVPIVGSDYLVKIEVGGLPDLYRVVTELPLVGESNIIYLVPKSIGDVDNIFDEYVWINNNWEFLGQSPVTVDLSNYYTKAEITALLSGKATVSDLTAHIADGVKHITPTERTDWNGKAPQTTTYTKTEVDNLIALIDKVKLDALSYEWFGTQAQYDVINPKLINTLYYIYQ